eukprot:749752-Ditylum_brightwellii.AAC.1
MVKLQSSKAGKQPTNSGSPTKKSSSPRKVFFYRWGLEFEDENGLAHSIYNVNALVNRCLSAAQNTEMMSGRYPFCQM